MNEEIRKNEIPENELENVSGGHEISDISGWEEGVMPVGAIAEA